MVLSDINTLTRLRESETSEGSSEYSDGSSSISYDDGSEFDFYRGGKQDVGQYIGMVRRPLVMYNRFKTKQYHKFPEYYQLFRTLYSLWKRTGARQINLSQLGTLLLAEDVAIFRGVSKPHLKNFLQRSIDRKFPVCFLDDYKVLDFESMVETIEAKEAVDRLVSDMQGAWF